MLFLVSAHNSLSQRALDRAHRARPRGDGRGRRLRRGDGGGRGRAPPAADRLPDAQDADPRVDLGEASLPGRAPGAAGRPRAVFARLGDRARRARSGASRSSRPTARSTPATSGRRVPSARARSGKSSLYRHEVRRAAIEALVEAVDRIADGGDARAAGLGARGVPAAPRPLMTPGRAGHRLGCRHHADRPAQDPRRRGPPRRAGRDRGHASSISSAPTASGRCAAAPGEIIATRTRRDLPGDRRRRRLDHPPQAPRHAGGALFKLPATRALALAGRGSTRPRSRRRRRAAAGRAHLPRDPLRGATPASATCTSTSTTAR